MTEETKEVSDKVLGELVEHSINSAKYITSISADSKTRDLLIEQFIDSFFHALRSFEQKV